MDQNTRYQFTPGTVFQRLVDEVVLINMENEDVFLGNTTTAQILRMIDEGLTFGEMVAYVTAHYEVGPAAKLGEDIAQILDYLAANALIEVVAPEEP